MTDFKASKRLIGTSSERTGLLVSVASSGTTTGGLGGAGGTISKVGAKLDNSSYTYIGQTIKQVIFTCICFAENTVSLCVGNSC